MENVKVIFTDIDGTLTNGKTTEVPSYVLLRMEELRRLGYVIVCVTGRSYGWCHAIINLWPIDAIIGENGAFYFMKRNENIETYINPQAHKSEDMFLKIKSLFPWIEIAHDQKLREFDLAIDIKSVCSTKLQELVKKCEELNFQSKVSSIHLNCWVGTYDKSSLCNHLINKHFTQYEDTKFWCFVGDSPNDECMFKMLPNHSAGVSTIRSFTLEHNPTVILSNGGGQGFIEFTNPFINRYTYVTLITNDFYAFGAIALQKSMNNVKSKYRLIVMCTRDVSKDSKEKLELIGAIIMDIDDIEPLEMIKANHDCHTINIVKPYKNFERYGASKPPKEVFQNYNNFNKLHVWKMTNFNRIIFLDSDTVMLKNIDNLFDTNEEFMGACDFNSDDVAKINSLNSGVFVTTPNLKTYSHMCETLVTSIHNGRVYERTDQTFLEEYFPNWNHLSYTYNANQYLRLAYPQALRLDQVRILHFAFQKPWEKKDLSEKSKGLMELHALWWNIYNSN